MYAKILLKHIQDDKSNNAGLEIRQFQALCRHLSFYQAYNLQTGKNKRLVLMHLSKLIQDVQDTGMHLILYYLFKDLNEPYTHKVLSDTQSFSLGLEDRHIYADVALEEIDADRTRCMRKLLDRSSCDHMAYQTFMSYIEKAERETTEKAYKELEEHDKHLVWEQLREMIHGTSDPVEVDLLIMLYTFMGQSNEEEQKIEEENHTAHTQDIFDVFFQSPSAPAKTPGMMENEI